MLHKTRGIVFRTIPYSDSSIIAHIYTRVFGLQSYLVSGAHARKSKVKATILQPLSIVEMSVTNREKTTLHRISDLVPVHAWTSIPFDIRKSSLVLFLNEILYKSIKEEESNPELFDFISHSLQILDLTQESCSNFHLVFLSRLAGLLGFAPHGSFSKETSIFNMNEGYFQSHEPSHAHFMPAETAEIFSIVLEANFENSHRLAITSRQRKALLLYMIQFYQLHISTMKEIKSHTVLEEVMG
jgi:DNA repair protein RecO (recombination protein O)